MARLYAEIQGNRGLASRMGSKKIWSHTRGWNFGIRVSIRVDDQDREIVEVYSTGGSNGYGSDHLIAQFIDGKSVLNVKQGA